MRLARSVSIDETAQRLAKAIEELDVLASPAPEPERLRVFVSLVRSLLEEWWDTKGHEPQSAKMGRKLH